MFLRDSAADMYILMLVQIEVAKFEFASIKTAFDARFAMSTGMLKACEFSYLSDP